MAYVSTNRGVWRLNNTLEDISLSNDFSVSEGNASYDNISIFSLTSNSFQNQKGLVFSNDNAFQTTLSSSFETSTVYTMGVGFWWYSKSALGFLKHTITGLPTPYEAPVISKANTETSAGIESAVAGEAEWILTEVAHSDTQNKMRLSLFSDGSNISDQIESEPYFPGLHYIYLEYFDQSGLETRIDIDGKTGVRYSTSNISDIATAKLRLNDSFVGYTAHKKKSSGSIMSDLVANRGPFDSLKARYFGYTYIATDTGRVLFSNFGFSYNRPTTITTNQIFTEGGNIFVARSNGEIFKGSRPIWDTEYNYINPSVVNRLNISETDETRKAEWTTRGLKLTGTTIRI